MEIPEQIEPGSQEQLFQADDDGAPRDGDLYLHEIFVYRVGPEDRENLQKRMDDVYDFVVHWDVRRGTPAEPAGFEPLLLENFHEQQAVKSFLFDLEEAIRPDPDIELELSLIPLPEIDGNTVHATQKRFDHGSSDP